MSVQCHILSMEVKKYFKWFLYSKTTYSEQKTLYLGENKVWSSDLCPGTSIDTDDWPFILLIWSSFLFLHIVFYFRWRLNKGGLRWGALLQTETPHDLAAPQIGGWTKGCFIFGLTYLMCRQLINKHPLRSTGRLDIILHTLINSLGKRVFFLLVMYITFLLERVWDN